jgi:hypothetical protein
MFYEIQPQIMQKKKLYKTKISSSMIYHKINIHIIPPRSKNRTFQKLLPLNYTSYSFSASFPGGSVAKNLRAYSGASGSIPDPEKSHRPHSN